MKMMINIATIQLPTLPMSESRLDYYLRICNSKGVCLVLLAEYVLNSFFKDLEQMPLGMIKEQSLNKIKMLKAFSHKYNLCIVAPIIIIKNGKKYKMLAKFDNAKVKFYEQNILMPYSHWNESKFFDNQNEIKMPIFKCENMKFGVIFGYEAHFDYFWQECLRKKLDCVLMPTACTFDTQKRWEELVKIRAFTNNLFILKANRIGKYKAQDCTWQFYGDSALINPMGEVELSLGQNEEVLVAKIDKKSINEARKIWKWQQILNKKGIL